MCGLSGGRGGIVVCLVVVVLQTAGLSQSGAEACKHDTTSRNRRATGTRDKGRSGQADTQTQKQVEPFEPISFKSVDGAIKNE